MDAISQYFTLSKIVNFRPMPSLSLRQDQIHIFKLPASARIPITVLGYGESDSPAPPATVEFWSIEDM